jgi:hypothetical protein
MINIKTREYFKSLRIMLMNMLIMIILVIDRILVVIVLIIKLVNKSFI